MRCRSVFKCLRRARNSVHASRRVSTIYAYPRADQPAPPSNTFTPPPATNTAAPPTGTATKTVPPTATSPTKADAQILLQAAAANTNRAESFQLESETTVQFGSVPNSSLSIPSQIRAHGKNVYTKFSLLLDPSPNEYMVVDGKGYIRGPAAELGIDRDGWYLAPESHHASDMLALARLFTETIAKDLSGVEEKDSVSLDGQKCRVYSVPAAATAKNFQAYSALSGDAFGYVALQLKEGQTRFSVCEDGYLHQIELTAKSDSGTPGSAAALTIKTHYFDLNKTVEVQAPTPVLPLPDSAAAAASGGLSGPKGKRDVHPSWSPDGSRIAFESDRAGNSDIYVMKADGSDVIQLTSDPFAEMYLPGRSPSDVMPSWSPDGQHITFVSGRDNIYWTKLFSSIFLMNADGSQVMQLTDHWSNSLFPVWSPDASRIAFTSSRDGGYDIFVMNADGSNVLKLSQEQANNVSPTWSPDGKQIAFSSDVGGVNQIYIMNSDGSNPVQLPQDRGEAILPAWSPDGKTIAFVIHTSDGENIYRINTDGSNLTQITKGKVQDGRPTWSPDGKRLAFSSNRDGNWHIYLMNADGSNVEQLTGK